MFMQKLDKLFFRYTMNHREEPLSLRNRKKMIKEVRSSAKQSKASTENQPPIRNLRGQNPAKRPAKVVKREIAELGTLKKIMKRKKAAKSHKVSKRTTPGGPSQEGTGPSYPHKEGSRWIKTVEKQTLNKAKRLVSKLNKRVKSTAKR